MKKLLAPLAVLAVSLSLSAGALAESHSKTLTLSQKTQVNGTTLEPGDYKVAYDVNGSTAQLNFFKGKKQVATASAQVKELNKKSDGTSVVLGTKSSVPTLDEVDFGGTTQSFQLSGDHNSQNAGQ